jgi:hypothetical protein
MNNNRLYLGDVVLYVPCKNVNVLCVHVRFVISVTLMVRYLLYLTTSVSRMALLRIRVQPSR